jgi:hypothetical protein
MNETPEQEQSEKEAMREFARARDSLEDKPRGSGSFLRGCGIALGIAFLLFAFVVGACFMAV